MNQLCECGCGRNVSKPGNRFIHGHSGGLPKNPEQERKLCKCGCGELANPGYDYVNGHNRRGEYQTDSAKEKISLSKMGNKNPMFDKNGNKHHFYGSHHTEKVINQMKGGNDIVNHHIAYDFNRPEVLIVKVTRKFHGSIHHPKGQPISERGYSLID